MLFRAPIRELKSGRIARRRSHTVVVMQHYPRGLSKELVDEYVHALAPERELFDEFKTKDRELKDHDAAFELVRYEERFALSAEGVEHLRRLSALAVERDVLLFCQCLAPERCHADLLLLMARHWFRGNTATVRIKYPTFEERLTSGRLSPD